MSKKLSDYGVKYSHYKSDSDYSEPKLEEKSSLLKFIEASMVKDPLLEVYDEKRAVERLRGYDEFRKKPYESYQHITPKVEPSKPIEVIKETSKEDLERAEALGYLKALRFVLNYLHTKELSDDEFAWLEEQIREHCKGV